MPQNVARIDILCIFTSTNKQDNKQIKIGDS